MNRGNSCNISLISGGVEKENNITVSPAESRGEIPSGALCKGKRNWQVIFQWFIPTGALLRGSGKKCKNPRSFEEQPVSCLCDG